MISGHTVSNWSHLEYEFVFDEVDVKAQIPEPLKTSFNFTEFLDMEL